MKIFPKFESGRGGEFLVYQIRIQWKGPFKPEDIIRKSNDGGKAPEWDGEDYGLYQIYGKHVISSKNALLYIGKATNQTFATRFKQHKKWLDKEEKIKVYLGRIYDPKRHSCKDKWKSWVKDVKTAEEVLLYKYSPNYNSSNIAAPPRIKPPKIIIHSGKRNRLETKDYAPEDFE